MTAAAASTITSPPTARESGSSVPSVLLATAAEALSARVEAAERLKEEVLTTLEKTHEMLDPEQRKRLAYLLRSGQLTI